MVEINGFSAPALERVNSPALGERRRQRRVSSFRGGKKELEGGQRKAFT